MSWGGRSYHIEPYKPWMAEGMKLLREDTAARHGAPCLWAVGEEWLWPGTLCALRGSRLIATAQVRPIVIATAAGEPHKLYLSINTLTRWEGDGELYLQLFLRILAQAGAMAAVLPTGHPALLGVSLLGTERAARTFYEAQGFLSVLHILAMEGSTDCAAMLPGAQITAEPGPLEDTFEAQAEGETLTLDMLGLPEPDHSGPPRQTVLVARRDDRVCGRLLLYEQGAAASIEDVYVARDCRGRGIAQALVADGLRLLAQRGYKRANLQVLSGNFAALALYRKLGFRQISEEFRYQRALNWEKQE